MLLGFLDQRFHHFAGIKLSFKRVEDDILYDRTIETEFRNFRRGAVEYFHLKDREQQLIDRVKTLVH